MTPQALADLIHARAQAHAGRFMLGLAGPPGSGKSTLAAALAALMGPGAKVVPMDGFHYDDAVLAARGLGARKGAPETFDLAGFHNLLARLRSEPEVAIPVFDRSMELSRAGADIVGPADRFLLIEGNYLLLDEPGWRDLALLFDLTVFLEVAEAELERRLLARWAHHGKTPAAARLWIEGNDMPNIRRSLRLSKTADILLHAPQPGRT